MASMSMALPTVATTPWPSTAAAAPSLRRRHLRGGVLPFCRAQKHEEQQRCTAEESKGVGKRVGGVLVPLLAAALVGGTPIMEAVMTPPVAIAVDVDSTAGQDSYKELLQKIKERRGRGGFTAPSPAPAPEPAQENISPAAARLKEAAEKARQEREANEIRAAQRQEENRKAREPAAPAIAEKEKAVVEKVGVSSPQQQVGVPSITIKQKTHGILPLFVSQFFLLLATLGVGAVLFVLPDSKLKEVQDKIDEFVEKATPVAEDAYAKAKPVATEAWQKAQEMGVVAKPYVEKVWQQAKPLAAKAVEASKPLLKEAQVKANELLQQAQEKSK